ncbi:hypothetical protein J6590_010093, partial [Homalodisca vitripennis]
MILSLFVVKNEDDLNYMMEFFHLLDFSDRRCHTAGWYSSRFTRGHQTVYSMVDIDCKNDLRDSNIQSTTENRCVQLSSGLINDTVEVDTIDSDELTWKTVSYKKSSSFDQSKSGKCVKGKEPRPIIGLVNKKGNQYGRVTKPVIIGSNTQRGGLKSVEKFKWVFISRCAPDTSVDDIVGYVTVDGIEVSKSEKLKTKYSDYSSFKVCILDKHFERVLCPDFWPEGVIVKEYDSPRNTFKSTNGPGVGVKPWERRVFQAYSEKDLSK